MHHPDHTLSDLHDRQPVLTGGVPLAQARGAVLLVHGRGASAADILELAREFDQPDLAYLAPQAAGNTWYPNRFVAPLDSNEPWLSSALARLGDVLRAIGDAGLTPARTALLGFSQGACLALEFAARNARRYGALVGLSGGLIGPDGTPRDYGTPPDARPLADTPVFLGCSDVDLHIPKERVEQTAAVLERLGARVTMRLYPGMGHTVNHDEIKFVQSLLAGVGRQPV
jgi:phospholipase/carboxylesterase